MPFCASVSAAQAPEGPPPTTTTRSGLSSTAPSRTAVAQTAGADTRSAAWRALVHRAWPRNTLACAWHRLLGSGQAHGTSLAAAAGTLLQVGTAVFIVQCCPFLPPWFPLHSARYYAQKDNSLHRSFGGFASRYALRQPSVPFKADLWKCILLQSWWRHLISTAFLERGVLMLTLAPCYTGAQG